MLGCASQLAMIGCGSMGMLYLTLPVSTLTRDLSTNTEIQVEEWPCCSPNTASMSS